MKTKKGYVTRLALMESPPGKYWKRSHYVKAHRGVGVLEFTWDESEALTFPSRAAALRARDAWMERDLVAVTDVPASYVCAWCDIPFLESEMVMLEGKRVCLSCHASVTN